MNYLTAEQILFIHFLIIEETGGSHGIRDLSLLESATARPVATFSANDLYPAIFSKAAALMHSLIKNHPFVDGNKRTAITAAAIFLKGNHYTITASNKELEQFTLNVASEDIALEDIAAWFRKHVENGGEPIQ